MLLFFFFKQKTAYEMRISDWSSDVCSSDLALRDLRRDPAAGRADRGTAHRLGLAHSLRDRRAARARRLSAPPRPRRNAVVRESGGHPPALDREAAVARASAREHPRRPAVGRRRDRRLYLHQLYADRKSTRLNSSH